MFKEIIKDRITIKIFETGKLMGAAAAASVAKMITLFLKNKDEVNIVFAAAPSQQEFLDALLQESIDWNCVNAFHMDEYIGLDINSTKTFAYFLKKNLFEKISCKTVNYLNGNAPDPASECNRYDNLLKRFPIDIVCMGIGENNHIAFNDPPVADFKDPETVKIVSLDMDCRQQQVNDGCFSSLDIVPKQAMTLTVPALLNCRYICCIVPGERKAKAVYHTINSPVTEKYPSTILREHGCVELFLDNDSGRLL